MKGYKRVAAYVDLDAIEDNFEAMKANLKEKTRIAAVVKANGYGHGAAPIARMIEKKDYPDKAAFDEALLRAAFSFTPNLICLAGYMRICGENLVNAFPHRIINIHPALLPSFRGLHAQRQAIEAGVKVAGCTVHFVGTGLDDGPIITQTAVPVYDNDTEETLSARILTREHPTYVRAVAAFCADKLTISGNHVSGMHSEEE